MADPTTIKIDISKIKPDPLHGLDSISNSLYIEGCQQCLIAGIAKLIKEDDFFRSTILNAIHKAGIKATMEWEFKES